MQINGLDKYADMLGVIDVLTNESRQRLADASVRSLRPFYELTLGEFFACIRGDFSVIGIRSSEDWAQLSVAQGFWVEKFRDFINEFIKVCEALKAPQTPEDAVLTAGVKPSTFEEAALLFARSYFGLPSFTAAADTTLGDYVIARKDDYNKTIIARAQAARMKKTKK